MLTMVAPTPWNRMTRSSALLLWILVTLGSLATGFQPAASFTRRASLSNGRRTTATSTTKPSLARSSSTTLSGSTSLIDDIPWEDLLQTTTSSFDTKALSKALADLHWETLFSPAWFATVGTAGQAVVDAFQSLPWTTDVGLALLPLLAFGASSLYRLSFPPEDYRQGMEPYERGNFDPLQARAYYDRHGMLVAQRLLQLLRLSNRFLFNLAFDKYILRDEERNREQRAKELLELVSQLGPTAIKVGQALSVRPDLIPTEYATALATLQDQVPPFDDAKARQVLKDQLDREQYARLQLSTGRGPVASASIGQVYRGTLDNGIDVAVKVQRPNVLAEIALDLYIVREFAPIYQKFTGGATDLQSLANEWGRGFIAELDYRAEAANTIRFREEMEKRNLHAVTAPRVFSDCSTEQVLITQWVDGKRLDESDADDVPRLCAVALNAYLVMLLELQSLHCDPHPGNLLRTNDGKLCILDFGMTLPVDPDLQYSLLEYVAHLTSDDYDKLPDDLVRLGFLKEDKLDFARRSGILEPLKYFLQQAGQGGGAKGVQERIFAEYREKYPGLTDDELRVEMRSEMKQQMQDVVQRESVATGITMEVEDLQRRNRDAFAIPEWFLYTSRAFLTLEGVSLQADENYSIIKSCFPYVAKRLVGDQDERAEKALRDLLYGASNSVDVDRLTDLADGFSSYTTTTKSINQQADAHTGEIILTNGAVERVSKSAERKNRLIEAEGAVTLAKDSADILLSPEGNLLQNLLVEEGALAASARVKDSIRRVAVDGPKTLRENLPFGSFLPPLPFEEQLVPFLRKSEDEIKAQALTEKLLALVPDRSSNGSSAESASSNGESITSILATLQGLEPEQAALVSKELRENVPRYAPLVGLLGEKFTTTLLNAASSNIEGTLRELELEGRSPDAITQVAAKGLSTVAQRGATALAGRRKEATTVDR